MSGPDCRLNTASLNTTSVPATFHLNIELSNLPFCPRYYKHMYVSMYYKSELLNKTQILLPYHSFGQTTHHFPEIYVSRKNMCGGNNTLREMFFADQKGGLVRVHFRIWFWMSTIKWFRPSLTGLECELVFGKDGGLRSETHLPMFCHDLGYPEDYL